MCNTTKQAMASFVIDTEFIGEYSIGGSEWMERRTGFVESVKADNLPMENGVVSIFTGYDPVFLQNFVKNSL